MAHYNQRYAFVQATPGGPTGGSSTDYCVQGLAGALNRSGKNIGLVSAPRLPLPRRLADWWYNVHVAGVLRSLDVDCVIGVRGDGYRYARKRDKPFVVYVPGVRTGAARAELAREQRACRAADGIIVTSEFAKSDIVPRYGLSEDRVRVVLPGVDPKQWPLRDPVSGPRPIVLCVTRPYRAADVGPVIAAWPEVIQRIPDAVLRIAGSPARPAPADRSTPDHDRVEWCGILRQEAMRLEFARSRVCIVPGDRAAVGRAAMEALATGRPVVTTHRGVARELAGPAAIAVDPAQPGAVAQELIRTLTDADVLAHLVTRARQRAAELSWTTSAQRFGEHIADL